MHRRTHYHNSHRSRKAFHQSEVRQDAAVGRTRGLTGIFDVYIRNIHAAEEYSEIAKRVSGGTRRCVVRADLPIAVHQTAFLK